MNVAESYDFLVEITGKIQADRETHGKIEKALLNIRALFTIVPKNPPAPIAPKPVPPATTPVQPTTTTPANPAQPAAKPVVDKPAEVPAQ